MRNSMPNLGGKMSISGKLEQSVDQQIYFNSSSLPDEALTNQSDSTQVQSKKLDGVGPVDNKPSTD